MVAGTPFEPGCAQQEEGQTRELWCVRRALPLEDAPPAAGSGDASGAEARPLNRLVHRIHARRARDRFALPPLADPPRAAQPSLRRGTIEGWWSARRARGDLDEFLRERLARYLARSGIDADRLPVAIDVHQGRVAVSPLPDRAPPSQWPVRYVRENGEPVLAADMERASSEARQADAALEEARERLAEARRNAELAARAPSLACGDGDDATTYGRPAVPAPWSTVVRASIALMVLGNAWQFAVPLLRAAGLSPADVFAEASRRPAAVALPLLLAAGASVCLFVFAEAAMRRARILAGVLPPRWRAAGHVVAGAASLAMAAGLAWAILGPGAAAGRVRDATPFLVAMALPLAAPALAAYARRLHAVRSEASRAAAAWDHVHRAAVARWTQASAVASAAERECAALAAHRETWTLRLHLLRTRAAEVDRRAADAAEADAADGRRFAAALASALELDRRAYLRARPVSGAEHVLDGEGRDER